MPKFTQASFVSVEANLRNAQVKRSGRNQNTAEQVQDGLDGEI
jgi:hypothetical protein